MNKGSVLVCFGYHVQSTRIGIDDRSGYDAELRERSYAGAFLHNPWYCGDSGRWIDKTNLPKWLLVLTGGRNFERTGAQSIRKLGTHAYRFSASEIARVWEHSLACQEGEDDSLHQADALDGAINMGFRARPETCMQNISALWKSFGTEDDTGRVKRLSPISIGCTLKAAYGLIVRERLRCVRIPFCIRFALPRDCAFRLN